MDLDIRRRQPWIGLEERTRRAGRDRQRSPPRQRVLHAGHDLPHRIGNHVIERDLLGTTHHHPDLQMILQVVADAGRVEHHADAVPPQQIRGADAGELQQLRRVVRAAGNQYFPARPRGLDAGALAIFDAIGTASVEQNALRLRRGLDMQIAAALRRTQIGKRRAGAPAVLGRGLEPAGALLGGAVEITVGGNAGFGGGDDERFRQRIVVP